MIRAAFGKLWAWLKPLTVEIADEWWLDIGEKPRPHFVSMVAGIFIYLAIAAAF
jgi:hypothetical protein